MYNFGYLIKNFFTHKDFLPPASELPGTMFTPLHFVFSAIVLAIVIASAVILSRKNEKTIKTVFIVVWAVMTVLEVTKIIWESLSGRNVRFEAGGILPLYPCSVFMYAMPFAIWGKDLVRKSACGYVCTIGLIGAAVNFFYPATILPSYSCISFAGFHTFFYHGAMLFACLTMLISGYHRYTNVKHWWELLLPALPLLIISIPANIVNYSAINSDYMFFKCDSFLFASLFGNMSNLASTIMIYIAYIIIPAAFYLPSYIKGKLKRKESE